MKIVADVPECIANQLDELTALCNRYPRKVPLGEVAKLLGIDRGLSGGHGHGTALSVRNGLAA